MQKHKRIFLIILTSISIFLTALVAIGAPTSNFSRTLLPEINETYDLGSTANKWLNIFTKNASTTDISIGAKLYDSTGSAGTNGKVLQTTGSATQWVATSTLGITQDLSGYVPYTGATSNLNLGINSLILNSLNGPLQANNGVVSATTSVGVMYGGTGITSPPSYGQLLVGNASSGYTLTATSSLGLYTPSVGSAGWMQFASSTPGYFDADSNFILDKVNDRIGVQVTSPQASIHAAAVTGSGLDDVVTGSATLTAESALTAPSATITQIAMPAGGGGGVINYVDPGAGTAIASANGTTYYFRIYPTLNISAGVTYYKSQNYEELSLMDPNDSQSYNIQVSWGTVTISGETVDYFVEYSTDGSSFSPLGVVANTSATYTSLTGSDPTTAWPTFYTAVSGTAPTPFDSGSAQAINIGTGGLNEVIATIYVEVDSVTNIAGVDYVSGTPTGGSFNDSGLGTYDAEVTWNNPGGSQTNAIARVSQDGVTWYYQYVNSTNSPFYFSSLTNDSAAEARWGQTYSGATPTQFDFTPYDIGTSPSGGTFYSSAGTGYNTTVSDSNFYIFKHVFTGLSGTAKIVENETNAHGKIVSATPYYDAGYTSWADGPTVTPNSYGFTGTNQNRDYKIYSYDSTSGIYGATPLTVSTVSGSGSKYVALAWTLPTGVTKVKILRQVNGGGYTSAKIITGSSFDDDSVSTWSDTTTVTPTSIILGAGRFDRAITTATEAAQLSVVDISGSGTRYSKITFGVAADSSSAITRIADIYSTSNTGYLSFVTGRAEILPSFGGTAMVLLGNTNTFNNHQSSSAHFTVKGLNDADLMNIRVDRDTVGFGQAQSGTDQATTVVIQPARSTDSALILVGHGSQTTTTEFFRTYTSGGTHGGSITLGGYFLAGAGTASNPGLSFRADANTGFYNVSADVFGVVTNGVERERRNVTGRYFGGGVAATDQIHIAAGTTSIAPLRLTTGSLTTGGNIRAGQLQFLTDKLHFTITTGTAVKEIALNDIALTSGRLALTTTNGRLTDLSTITYTAGVITATGFTGALNGTLGATTPASAIVTSLQADTITNDTGLAHGTYTPTLTGVTNVTSSTARQATYMRVGNTVTVSGQLDITTTGNNTRTTLGISLPIASAFSTGYELGGTAHTITNASANDSEHASVAADATNDRAELDFFETKGATETFVYTFTYQVI